MPTVYFEDLEVGSVHLGRECVCDKDEMLEFSRRNDPWPFHVDEAAATLSPYGGIVASGGCIIFFLVPSPLRASKTTSTTPGVPGGPFLEIQITPPGPGARTPP